MHDEAKLFLGEGSDLVLPISSGAAPLRLAAFTTYPSSLMICTAPTTYCPNTTAANALHVHADGIDLWWSYKTLVAFQAPGGDLVVRRNDWGPTTGKHLNAIDGGDKAGRVDGPTFQRLLSEVSR